MSSIYTDKQEYAISTWTCDALPLKQSLEIIAKNGFSSVELWGDTVHFDPRAGIDRTEIKKWLSDNKLSVHSVHAPFRNFPRYTDKEAFLADRIKLWKTTIQDCSNFEIGILVIHGLDRYEYNYTRDQLEQLRDLIESLCRFGAPYGVKLALENIPGSKKTPDEIPCSLQDHMAHFGDIPELCFCLDIGHVVLTPADFYKEIDSAADRLITFHVHNNDGTSDIHSLPDKGVIDWPNIRNYIRQKGYKGQFVMEVLGGTEQENRVQQIAELF